MNHQVRLRPLVFVAALGLFASLQGACGGDDTGSGGSGGSGGAGGGPGSGGTAMVCEPGATKACYDGPAATENQGVCKAGKQTCSADGSGFGPCKDQVVPQPENCATSADEDCDGKSPKCTGDVAWDRIASAPAYSNASSVCVDASGSAYVVGFFQDSLAFPDGSTLDGSMTRDATVVAKFDPQGTLLWATRFLSSGTGQNLGEGCAVLPESGGVVVTGTFTTDIDFGEGPVMGGAPGVHRPFVATLDADGALVWQRTFATTIDGYFQTAAVDADGSVIMGGGFTGKMPIDGDTTLTTASNANGNGVLVKLDAKGKPEWAKQLTGLDGATGVYGVAVRADGAIGATGQAYGPADFGAGPASTTAGPDADVFVALFTTAGKQISLAQYGDGAEQFGAGIRFDPAGNAFVSGSFQGHLADGFGSLSTDPTTYDAFVLKLDTHGKVVAHAAFGVTGSDDYASRLAVDGAGNVVLSGVYGDSFTVGDTTFPPSGGFGAFLVKLDNAATPIWAKSFAAPSSTSSWVNDVDVDHDANVYAAGRFETAIDFDATYHETAAPGTSALYLVKLAP